MRTLPRLFAVTTDAICDSATFTARAAAVATLGPAAALVVRAPASTAATQAGFAGQAMELARPTRAQLFVHARPDLARAVGAQGVQLRRQDLAPRDARSLLPDAWLGVSVHDREAGEAAVAEGADYLVAGSVFASASHPGRPARGLAWLATLCTLGVPVVAIGGVTPARAASVREAGAWGAAVIGAVWDAADPGAAARGLLDAWSGA